MKYAACIQNIKEHTVDVIPVGETVDPDDDRYLDQDIHVIPCPGGVFTAGCHELKRECACHVKVDRDYARVLVIHNDRVN